MVSPSVILGTPDISAADIFELNINNTIKMILSFFIREFFFKIK